MERSKGKKKKKTKKTLVVTNGETLKLSLLLSLYLEPKRTREEKRRG
jgi:hypothetical protein